ncbi:siphovirus ReqiPepy6 Gp37-like family protein [Virgibacillus halodenitrificans]|uniref:siphovirus ReqiPepy6 Gp37-like family protein n=1 Tax=Virgibacillus halodenitrificans TaxID=1482 RepID=UPI0019255569|nr:siphovirus ReqiPepy6 Gp37-like family protein [Virgibacillus halodenitrificans]
MKMPIRIYNEFLDLQGEIDTYQSLQFGRSYHGIATFELHVNRYMHEAEKLEKGNLIALNKQSNKVAIIMTKEIALDQNGKETENFKLTGYTLDGLMTRRLTEPPSNDSHDRVKGNAETVMKHYVSKHFVHPDDPDRIFPHMEIATDRKRGNYFEWDSRYKIVADELENISIKSGLGWGIFADFKTKKLIFDVIEARDLTQDNPFGNHPVFFSPEFETIKSQGFINSDNDLKTVGYVGGQGEGAERKVIKLGNETGWDRIETFIDARDVGEGEEDQKLTPEQIEQQLAERGQSKLNDMQTIYTLEAEILTPTQESPFQYEKDFDLGDKVDVVNKLWRLKMTAPITEFMEIHEPGGFRLEGTFGRSRPTLISKIKNKFDELDGVEKQELPAQIAVETKEYTNQKVSEEEKKRIEQAKENLQTSKQYTEEYAEKVIPEQPIPPDNPVVGDKWVDTSRTPLAMKIFNGTVWDTVQGPQGIPGEPGENGQSLYTWVKYADSPTSGMSDSPLNKEYIGLAYNKTTPVESSNYADYTWAKTKGDQGVPGEPGKNGEPRFTWTKYADDKDGSGISDNPEGKRYLGLAYNKTTATESNNTADYSWSPLYDNVKPGVTNLLLSTKSWGLPWDTPQQTRLSDAQGTDFAASTNASLFGYLVSHANMGKFAPGIYTFSMWVKADVEFSCRFGYRNGDGVIQGNIDIPTEWTKISFTFTTTNITTAGRVVYWYPDGNKMYFCFPKLEKGNVATDWTPAPEDVAQDAQDKADAAQAAAEAVAVAEANLAETQANAYADGKVSAEEARAIQDAKNKLAEAKADAKAKADAAELAAKGYTENYSEKKRIESTTAPTDIAALWIDTSRSPNVIKRHNGTTWVKLSPTEAAEIGAETPTGAQNKANQAESNAKEHTDTIINTNKPKWDRALFFNPDGTLNVEKLKGLLTDAQLASAARWNGRTTKIGDDGIYTGTMIAEQIIAGVLNADNVEIKGANGGVTINAQGVNAKNADFTLEDDISNTKYSATPKRNIVKDHSFELVRADVDSMNSSSVQHNWLEMREPYFGDYWRKFGSPKVATVFGPDSRSALPIFGEKAIVVRDANFISQDLYDGIAGGMTLTASGFFKRQHNVVGGGTPRFEIDHIDPAGGFLKRLTNTVFPAVPDDYSIVRHSLTFQVPINFSEGDSLVFKISGGNTSWVQCDGIQIVEDNVPAVYMPEDATWEIVKGNYPVSGKNRGLWHGAVYLTDKHTIKPDKLLSECANGWILQWEAYNAGSGVANSDYQYTYLPWRAKQQTGTGHRELLGRGGIGVVGKYFYVYNDKIIGHSSNASGDATNLVLTGVYEY